MVDYLSYFQYGPQVVRNGVLNPNISDENCMCSDCEKNEGLATKYRTYFDTTKAYTNAVWEDEQYMLCPPRLLGYILSEKQWAQLQVTSIREIPPNDPHDAWNTRLQLADDNKTKNMLFSLVQSHVSTISQEANPEEGGLEVNDIIPGKGKGLVILLYGMILSIETRLQIEFVLTYEQRTTGRRQNFDCRNYCCCYSQTFVLYQRR